MFESLAPARILVEFSQPGGLSTNSSGYECCFFNYIALA
jgi:hypothetical protein